MSGTGGNAAPSLRSEWPAALLACLLALGFSLPVLRDLDHWGIQDWDFQLHHHAVPRLAILEHGQLPLWNPYNWSGLPMLAHPESRVLAPTFLLTLAFGEVVGIKLEIVLHLALGILGAHLLLRSLGASRLGGATGGALFMLNSAYPLHLTVGHVWALSFAYLPWALLFYRKALNDLRYSLAVSGVLLLTFFGGAPYQLMITLALLGVFAGASVVVERRGLLRHARLFLAIGLQVALLGAVKLVPTVELMSTHPRLTEAASGYTPSALLHALFDRDQTLDAAFAERPEEFHGTPLHEGAYVGLLALLPLALGIASSGRRLAPLLVTLVVLVWISLGRHAPLDLWGLIHQLPGFDNMRMVQRFGLGILLVLSIFVGLGVDALEARVRRWTGRPALARGAAAALAVALLADLALVNAPILADAFPIPPLAVEPEPDFRQVARWPPYDAQGFVRPGSQPHHRTLSAIYPATLANVGSTRGYRIIPSPTPAIPQGAPGYRGEVHPVDGARAVTTERWTPNRIEFAVEAPDGGGLVVNQAFDPGWRARTAAGESRPVAPRDGLLAIGLSPGDRRVALVYRPTSVLVGAAVSLLSLVGLAGWWVLGSRR